MKNVAIALNAGTPEQRNAITEFIAGRNLAYWHWVDDFWIVQLPNTESLRSFHDQLEVLPDVNKPTMLVFEFSGAISYWGRAPKDAWAWLSHIGGASA